MPVAELMRAGEELASGLARISPGSDYSMHLLDRLEGGQFSPQPRL